MRLACIALTLSLCSFSFAAAAPVHVWQGTLTLPTYEEGPPDPNPPFDLFSTTRFNYPYTIRDKLTDQRVDHAWRAVYLENKYLKCSVLPDIGGHVYTCMDKLSGQPMFYANPSIKKAQIGYRGAWAAFGIEFNFPVSHNWVSMSPVDFAYSAKPDGSASVTVGNIDRVYGMEWSVELILRSDSTVLEERVKLYNRGDVRHRFYWWNNAGVQVWDDSRIQYPMRWTASHGFTEVQPWPVDADGIDLSVIHNQTKGPVSLFVHGSREPFMGVWHPHTNTGVVHFADYADLPGKKIWSWGVDADGLDWRKALSDNDSAYVEVQGGLFRNQETYAFLNPRQAIRFSEFWMPVREIGGIARANLHAVVNLSRSATTLATALNVNEPISGAMIRIRLGDRIISEERVDLAPEHVWRKEVPDVDPHGKYSIDLLDGSDRLLLRHTEGEYDWSPAADIKTGPQASYKIPAPESRTADDWLRNGVNQELNGELLQAFDTYHNALRKFPESFDLNKAAGRLAASLLRYDDAVHYLAGVQARDTTDAEIAYYLGIAFDGVGDPHKARNAYESARRLPEYRAAASVKLAELTAREGRLENAKRYFEDALGATPDDLRTAEELVAVRNASGDSTGAHQLAEQSLKSHPLSYFLREELREPDPQHLAADPYRVLNLAAEYMRLGLYDRALAVLSRSYPSVDADQSEPGSLLPQNHPLVLYFRAYCKEQLQRPAASDYEAASHASTAYVFPNTAESLEVLHAALRANPADATAHYLLGTFLFSRALVDPAISEWQSVSALKSSLPVLNADLGNALLRVKHDPAAALTAFEEGRSSDPRNPLIYSGMDQALSLLNRPAQDRVDALQGYPDSAHMPSELLYELALNRAEAGDFDGALALFKNRFFSREEGGTNVRQVWIEVRVEQILSDARAGQCDAALSSERTLGAPVTGVPFTADGLEPFLNDARTQYLLGKSDLRCAKKAQANDHFRAAASHKEPSQIVWAHAAAANLDGFSEDDWTSPLHSALARMENNADSSFSAYLAAMLHDALGDRVAARESIRQALFLPDRFMAHHLARVALAELTPG